MGMGRAADLRNQHRYPSRVMRPCDNPFRVGRLEALPFQPQGTDWAALEGRLHELGLRASIVGPEGSGKTTLLRELSRRLEASGWRTRRMQLTLDRRRFTLADAEALTRGAGPRDVILFDGAGHLSLPRWWAFRRMARRAGGVIITAHRGRRLPVLLRTRTDAALLEELVASLLGEAKPAPVRAPGDLAALYRRHGGNIREALRDLYDHYAE